MGLHTTVYSLTKSNPTLLVGDMALDRWLSLLFESRGEALLRIFWHRIQDLMTYNNQTSSPLSQRGSYKIKYIHLNSTVNVNSYENGTFTKYVVDYTVITVFYLRTIKKKKKTFLWQKPIYTSGRYTRDFQSCHLSTKSSSMK